MTKEKEYGNGVDTDIQTFMKRLSNAIAKELGARNVSIVTFSELQGVCRNTVSAILSGKKQDVRLSTLFLLCDGTSISLPDLLFGYERKVGDVIVEVGNKKYYANLIGNNAFEVCNGKIKI